LYAYPGHFSVQINSCCRPPFYPQIAYSHAFLAKHSVEDGL
jgi:hypothetical protein